MNRVIAYTIAYNAEKTLPRAIESVLSQTFGDFTYYIVDNASLDGTGSVIRAFAERDKRIVALSNTNNNIFKQEDWFINFLNDYDDTYRYCTLDADDEYKPDFLDKTLAFSLKHDLDIAVAGSDYIDADSGNIVEQKTIEKDLIIEGRSFADNFLQYRKYVNAFWNKLFKPSVISKLYLYHPSKMTFAIDTAMLMTTFRHAKRVGFLSQSTHKYYIYPKSESRTFNLDRLDDCSFFFQYYVDFLRRFGPVSSLNMDYLYAIWLGWMDDFIFKPLRGLDLPAGKKLSLISDVFANSVTKAMLRRKADPRFRNLAAREDFLQGVCAWMYAQEESRTAAGRAAVAKILKNMETRPKERA